MIKVINPNPLSDYLGRVPSQFYNDKVEAIKKGCGIDRQTFRNWASGLCRVPPPGQILINQILKKKIFDV